MRMDNGKERIPGLARIFILAGLFLAPPTQALTGASLAVNLTPGLAAIDDFPFQCGGRENLAIYSGSTLAASSEIIADVVIYWNPRVSRHFLLVVNGTAVLTTAGAVAPTDAEVVAAVGEDSEGVTYPWARVGRVKFSRNSGTTIDLEYLDHTVRPMEIDATRKATGAAAATQEKDPIGSPLVYEFLQTMAWHVDAADIAAADVITDHPLPACYGKIGAIRATCEKAVTTGAKAAKFHAEIGATATTGGVVSLAGAYALGAVVAGSAITALHTFKPGDTVSLVGSDVTTFIEGRFALEIDLYRLVT